MSLLHSDGARHKRLRSLTLKVFSKSRLDAFRSRAKEICETLLDAALVKDEFNFVTAIGRPMPTIVITDSVDLCRQGQQKGASGNRVGRMKVGSLVKSLDQPCAEILVAACC